MSVVWIRIRWNRISVIGLLYFLIIKVFKEISETVQCRYLFLYFIIINDYRILPYLFDNIFFNGHKNVQVGSGSSRTGNKLASRIRISGQRIWMKYLRILVITPVRTKSWRTMSLAFFCLLSHLPPPEILSSGQLSTPSASCPYSSQPPPPPPLPHLIPSPSSSRSFSLACCPAPCRSPSWCFLSLPLPPRSQPLCSCSTSTIFPSFLFAAVVPPPLPPRCPLSFSYCSGPCLSGAAWAVHPPPPPLLLTPQQASCSCWRARTSGWGKITKSWITSQEIQILKNQCCGAWAEEPKLNCLPEPELKSGTAAPALSIYLTKTKKQF